MNYPVVVLIFAAADYILNNRLSDAKIQQRFPKEPPWYYRVQEGQDDSGVYQIGDV